MTSLCIGPTIRRVVTPAGDPAWLVTGYDDVKALLSDPRLGRSHPEPDRAARFSNSAIFGGPMGDDPAAEAGEHARMRRLLVPAFSARRMSELAPRVEAIATQLLDDMLDAGPPVDFHEAVSFPLPALVICELLGVPYEDRDDFRRWSDQAAHITDAELSQAGLAALWNFMHALVDRKRQQPGRDVISELLATADQDPDLSSDGIAMLAAALLFAGHETTVAAIDRGVALLLTHPDQYAALQRDPSRVAPAVEEILRSSLPVPSGASDQAGGLPRYAHHDIEFGGVSIAAGELVLLGLQGANQDHGTFPEPDRFDTQRTPNQHLSFGHGPRFCIGAPLARVELRILLTALPQRLPTLRLAVPAETLRSRDQLLTGGLVELPVTW